jgi:hypothetical protein
MIVQNLAQGRDSNSAHGCKQDDCMFFDVGIGGIAHVSRIHPVVSGHSSFQTGKSIFVKHVSEGRSMDSKVVPSIDVLTIFRSSCGRRPSTRRPHRSTAQKCTKAAYFSCESILAMQGSALESAIGMNASTNQSMRMLPLLTVFNPAHCRGARILTPRSWLTLFSRNTPAESMHQRIFAGISMLF